MVKNGMDATRIAVIDAKPLDQVAQDPRSIALSWGSRQFLDSLGAWPDATDPIHTIHVSRRGHFGRTLISREDVEVPALGYVARYGTVLTQLADAAERAGAAMLRPVRIQATHENADAVEIALDNGERLQADILVLAEGGTYAEQAPKTLRRDYEQIAIVAHVAVSAPVAHRAFERFTDEGPLALLPQDDGYALVWCARADSIAHLIGLPDTAFLEALEHAFGGRLGRFTKVSARNTFPLGLNADPATSQRTVAIGNAAQTLHPVAGQGLNLGLRDAVMLAALLTHDASPASLQNFAAERRADRGLTIRLTDTMARIFSSAPEGTLAQHLLGTSLAAFDVIRPAKTMLAEQMMYGWRA